MLHFRPKSQKLIVWCCDLIENDSRQVEKRLKMDFWCRAEAFVSRHIKVSECPVSRRTKEDRFGFVQSLLSQYSLFDAAGFL